MVEEIDRLLLETSPEIQYENIIVPNLLDEAVKTGITNDHRLCVRDVILSIPQDPKSVIMCSCSTFGSCAEELQEATDNQIIRIDRPMAEKAIDIGLKIGVAAALKSTLAPLVSYLNQLRNQRTKRFLYKTFFVKRPGSYANEMIRKATSPRSPHV